MLSAAAIETMGRPHLAQSGLASVCVRAATHAWQNGMRLPVSSIRAQIRQGAGNTSEARASRIPRHWERTEALGQATLPQAYASRASEQREKSWGWHESCQARDERTRNLFHIN